MMIETENKTMPVVSFFEEPKDGERKTTVVYLDGSYGRLNGINSIGVGIFMVNEDGSNLKIANGYSDSKNKSGVLAERQTFIDFVSFVHEAGLHENTDFVIYGDCEPLIEFLNKEEWIHGGILGFSKEFIEAAKQISIKGAYWVKGHREELGNLVVDSLAINAMRGAMFSKKNVNGFYENIPMSTLLDNFLKRCPDLVRQEVDEFLFNQKCFNRHLDTEQNIINKEMSNILPERVKLCPTEKGFKAVIVKDPIKRKDENGNEEQHYVLAHRTHDHQSQHDILKQLLGDALRMKQRLAFSNKPIEIMFPKGELSETVDRVLREYKSLQTMKINAELDSDDEAIQEYRNNIKNFMGNKTNRQISELYKFSTVTITTHYETPESKKKQKKKQALSLS
jgi:ribonuclease HI